MCNRPDFEGEDAELDAQLLKTFQMWTDGMKHWLTDEEMAGIDLVEQFSKEVRDRLVELRKPGKAGCS